MADHTANAGRNYRFNAGTGAALVRAGFQIDVESSSASFFAGLLDGENLRMLEAVVLIIATSHDGAAGVKDDGSHQRIRRHQPCSLTC